MKKLPPKRSPVRGWMEIFGRNDRGAYVIKEKRSAKAQIPVIIALSEVWEPVLRKRPAKIDTKPIVVKAAWVHDNHILFNGGIAAST